MMSHPQDIYLNFILLKQVKQNKFIKIKFVSPKADNTSLGKFYGVNEKSVKISMYSKRIEKYLLC